MHKLTEIAIKARVRMEVQKAIVTDMANKTIPKLTEKDLPLRIDCQLDSNRERILNGIHNIMGFEANQLDPNFVNDFKN